MDIEIELETGIRGAAGKDGKDGITPTIGENGNWFFGTTDTGVPARGKDAETPTPDDALALLDETGVACAMADEGGAVLTDDADNILIY